MNRTSTDFLSRQVTLQISLPISRIFDWRTDISESRARDGGIKTEHLTVRTTDAHFSRARMILHQRTCVWLKRMSCAFESAFSQKSSCRHMFPPHVTPRAASSARYATCCAWSAGCHASQHHLLLRAPRVEVVGSRAVLWLVTSLCHSWSARGQGQSEAAIALRGPLRLPGCSPRQSCGASLDSRDLVRALSLGSCLR